MLILIVSFNWISYFIEYEKIVVPDILELTRSDIKIYQEFRKEYDKKILKDLSPKDITKIYFYSIYILDFDTSYKFGGQKNNEYLIKENVNAVNSIEIFIESIELFDTVYIDNLNAKVNYSHIYNDEKVFSEFRVQKKSLNEEWRVVFGFYIP